MSSATVDAKSLTGMVHALQGFNTLPGYAPEASPSLQSKADIEVVLRIATESIREGSLFCTEGSNHACLFDQVRLYQNLGREQVYKSTGTIQDQAAAATALLGKSVLESSGQVPDKPRVIAKIVGIVCALHAESSRRLAEEEQNPLPGDVSFLLANMKQLHDIWWDKEERNRQIASWKGEGVLSENATVENVFELRGRIHALRVLVKRSLHMARSVNAIASCIDAVANLEQAGDSLSSGQMERYPTVSTRTSETFKQLLSVQSTESNPTNSCAFMSSRNPNSSCALAVDSDDEDSYESDLEINDGRRRVPGSDDDASSSAASDSDSP